MRFDLLDEYSTLVPFGRGVARDATLQKPAVPAKRGTNIQFAGYFDLPRRTLALLLRIMASGYRWRPGPAE